MNARETARRIRRLPSDVARWFAIARTTPVRGEIRVSYGRDIPPRDRPAHGGTVKFQALADVFPNARADFNVLYLGSSTVPDDAAMLVRLARRRGAAIVWNQNGVAYPGWHGPGWERVNSRLARVLHAADHVLYQSDFCRLSADRFCGGRDSAAELLHNPVDTERFTPEPTRRDQPTLLLGGNQYQRYRLETALRTLLLLPPEWRLLVTGAISWRPDHAAARREADGLVAELGVSARVELRGRYTQDEAPALMRRAHVLLHTKYNDPCPTVVLEAMACGLPVVYSASGGTPELVAPDAGVGIPAPLDWERDHPPDPEALARGVLALWERLPDAAEAARRSAERFDVRPWIERHRRLFEELVR